MKHYEYLLFDNDGTLMDFKRAQETAFEISFRRQGFPLAYSREVLDCYEKNNLRWWKKLEEGLCSKDELQTGRFRDFLEELGLDADPNECNRDYMEALGQGRFLMPEALETLRELHRDYKICIITNGVGHTQRSRIEKSAIAPFVDALFISEEAGHAKPSRAYFDHVLKAGGISDKNKCLVIGDSLTSDIQGANNAGMDCCWYNPEGLIQEGLRIDYEVRCLSELLPLLREHREVL